MSELTRTELQRDLTHSSEGSMESCQRMIAMDNLPFGIILLDETHRVVYRNSAARLMVTANLQAIGSILRLPEALITTGRASMNFTGSDGTHAVYDTHYTVLKDDPDAYAMLSLVNTDLAGAAQSSNHFHVFFEMSHIGAYRSTPSGNILMANPAMVEMLGYASFNEIAGCTLMEMRYHPDNPRSIFLEKMEERGEVIGLESAWIGKDGSPRYVREHARAFYDDEGVLQYYEGTVEDITERKSQEEMLLRQAENLRTSKDLLEQKAKELELLNAQLLESDKELRDINASKDMFFSILAHDLRSPFATIMGFSDLLLADFESLSKDDQKEIALQINKTTHHVYNLLNNLLAWSRIQTGRLDYQPIKVDVWETVISTINMFLVHAIKKRIELKNTVPLRLCAWADKTMLESILQNLISNAIKFTAEGGTVLIAASESDGIVEFSITDTGVGMKSDQIESLFKIDQQISTPGTAKEKGTGLGLILCHELVKILGGVVFVESQEGSGSTFRFTIPSHAPTAV